MFFYCGFPEVSFSSDGEVGVLYPNFVLDSEYYGMSKSSVPIRGMFACGSSFKGTSSTLNVFYGIDYLVASDDFTNRLVGCNLSDIVDVDSYNEYKDFSIMDGGFLCDDHQLLDGLPEWDITTEMVFSPVLFDQMRGSYVSLISIGVVLWNFIAFGTDELLPGTRVSLQRICPDGTLVHYKVFECLPHLRISQIFGSFVAVYKGKGRIGLALMTIEKRAQRRAMTDLLMNVILSKKVAYAVFGTKTTQLTEDFYLPMLVNSVARKDSCADRSQGLGLMFSFLRTDFQTQAMEIMREVADFSLILIHVFENHVAVGCCSCKATLGVGRQQSTEDSRSVLATGNRCDADGIVWVYRTDIVNRSYRLQVCIMWTGYTDIHIAGCMLLRKCSCAIWFLVGMPGYMSSIGNMVVQCNDNCIMDVIILQGFCCSKSQVLVFCRNEQIALFSNCGNRAVDWEAWKANCNLDENRVDCGIQVRSRTVSPHVGMDCDVSEMGKWHSNV